MTAKEREAAIENWIVTTVQNGGIERFDDLHVDQIDPQGHDRQSGLRAGMEAYRGRTESP